MADERERGITKISVSGYKSIRDERHIEIRPLTILAGANSSGKSSIMQPMLMMKQTLDASLRSRPTSLEWAKHTLHSVSSNFCRSKLGSTDTLVAGFEIS